MNTRTPFQNAASFVFATTMLVSAGCGSSPSPAGSLGQHQGLSPSSDAGTSPDDGGTPSGGDASSSTNADAGATDLAGMPCDIQALLSTYCTSCHGASLAGNAPMHLTSIDDLSAPAFSDASKSMAEASVLRMRDSARPMPPAGATVPETDVQAFEDWVAQGMPAGSCDTSNVNDPFAAAPTCTTDSYWTGGNTESPNMNPGQACISCHSRGEGPSFSVAGTLFASGHEPDNCKGVNGTVDQAEVEITDANGQVFSIGVNSSGNFFSERSVVYPITARVLYQGRSRAMLTAQPSGDCNSCHSQNGADGAPGRIALP